MGRALFSVFGIAILGLVVLAVRGSPGWTWLGLVLGAPATVLLLIQALTGDDALLPYSSALEAILYLYAAGALIAYMLADHVITRDELFAVGATFTLVAWAFAYAFTVSQAIEPGSFSAAVNPQEQRSWVELLFLSFTTLTSTGLSDVVPGQAVRAQPRDDRAARRARLRGDAGVAGRGPDGDGPAPTGPRRARARPRAGLAVSVVEPGAGASARGSGRRPPEARPPAVRREPWCGRRTGRRHRCRDRGPPRAARRAATPGWPGP